MCVKTSHQEKEEKAHQELTQEPWEAIKQLAFTIRMTAKCDAQEK